MDKTKDEMLEEYAERIVEVNADVKEGDKVYLHAYSTDVLPLFDKVRRKIIKKGAYPHEHLIYDSQLGRAGMDYDWMKHGSKKQQQNISKAKKKELEEMDVYINLGGRKNENELNGVNTDLISLRKKSTKVLADLRRDMRWVLAQYPTDAKAQKAGMPTEEFEDLVLSAATKDLKEQRRKNEKIKKKFDKGEKVKIVSKNTEIEFSIKNREGVSSDGTDHNIPSGEVFYAPVKGSVEGYIEFTYPGRKQGNEVTGVYLEFEKGKVVDFKAEKNEEFLRNQLNTDEGSSRFGEFGIGTNREIDRFTNELGLDEKIGGTVHFALGSDFPECVPEGEERNDSSIHWDIIKDLRSGVGDGGKIILDGEVVQEDGEWQF